ncbi:GMC oxidoreductase [Membranihabitans maritimus]|uniref:GMC oxidoreductase n=1 Tax=Membranihabitans maritimus TaxID=2904244 RepID=UPI001F1ADF11|nr:GMC family oxidoreductase [Membranihabitans maritimus]
MKSNFFDAIVVGTGISGGWAAKELCEKGLNTLVLERGRDVEHIVDYDDMIPPWDTKYRGRVTNEDRRKSPIQSGVYNYNERSKKYFVNDLDNPYVQDKPFEWARGYQVGGRSLIWGRQCYRRSELDFEANAKDGFGVDWPIRYKDIAPWYDYVEPVVGVSGSIEGLAHLPDGLFQPPMPMNCVESEVARRIKGKFEDGRMIIHGRTANHTRKIGNRGPCQYKGSCGAGHACSFGGYFSSNSATLPLAAKTGKMTLRPFSMVQEIIYDKETRKATGVRVVDTETLESRIFHSKIIFLNASTLNTTAILLNSISEVFPTGLGNSSGQLGHNLMDMPYGMGARGTFKGFEDKFTFGRRPTGIFVPRFRNINKATEQQDYVRGFTYQGGAGRGRKAGEGFGRGYKEELTKPSEHWSMAITAWGEHLPYYENKMYLHKDKKDKFGMPVICVDCEFKENEAAMVNDMMNSAAEILEMGGLKDIETYNWNKIPGSCIHETGTARMGNDPGTSVLNRWNQMHDVKNIFITDGSAMCSSGTTPGPSITYMALTARAVDYAVKELNRRNI